MKSFKTFLEAEAGPGYHQAMLQFHILKAKDEQELAHRKLSAVSTRSPSTTKNKDHVQKYNAHIAKADHHAAAYTKLTGKKALEAPIKKRVT